MEEKVTFDMAAGSVERAVEAARERIQNLSKAMDGVLTPTVSLAEVCRVYDVIRTLHEGVEEAEKALSKLKQHLAVTVLPRKFEDDGVSTVSLRDLGARFTVTTRVSASMADKAGAVAWLRGQGFGDIVQETVNASTLSSFAKEYVTDHGRDLPQDLFKVSSIQHVSRTKI